MSEIVRKFELEFEEVSKKKNKNIYLEFLLGWEKEMGIYLCEWYWILKGLSWLREIKGNTFARDFDGTMGSRDASIGGGKVQLPWQLDYYILGIWPGLMTGHIYG